MFKLALQSIINRKKILSLVFFSLCLSVTLFLGVQRTKEVTRNSFSRTISGTDLIVGARTGQVNLILYSVFHMGRAVNNMGFDAFKELASHDEVAWAIPLSMGDSYRGFRVIGTEPTYFEHYSYGRNRHLEFSQGAPFEEPFGVVLGAAAAKEFNHKVGDSIVVSHGVAKNSIDQHENLPFTITGILEGTGTPVDKSVFVPLEGITAIHLGWEGGFKSRDVSREQALMKDLEPESITSALIGLKNRGTAFQFQRLVGDYEEEALMAILPGVALYELWGLVGVADKALTFISGAVVLVGLLSLLSTQLAVVNLRRREMALYRSLGATPKQLFQLLITESFLLTSAGCVAGLALLYLIQLLLSILLKGSGFFMEISFPSPTEWLYFTLTLVLGTLISIIPAVSTYRQSLSDGMSVKS
ncbi:MAG: FtsX-like permease family protein [Spirochaetales bacterium]|nr:FtsX-like permease family protein [Spirochaetales bacterium]